MRAYLNWLESFLAKEEVAGSNPVARSKNRRYLRMEAVFRLHEIEKIWRMNLLFFAR